MQEGKGKGGGGRWEGVEGEEHLLSDARRRIDSGAVGSTFVLWSMQRTFFALRRVSKRAHWSG